MKKLCIIGAGGFGREVLAWARQHPDFEKEWTIQGFIDDDPHALRNFEVGVPIIGSIRHYLPSPEDCFICAIGAPAIKRQVCEQLLDRGGEFISLVHPSVIMGDSIKIGRGVVLCPGVILTTHICIGDFVAINCLSSVGHDVQIGDWTTISGHCDLTGNTRYGEEAFLGSGARILPGKHVGDRAFVGAGSTVIRSVSSDTKVFGNPARPF